MDKLADWLESNAPERDETTIAHGDFRLEDMIFHPTEPRPVAVIDWELATLGHPRCDLGYNCMTYHLPSSMIGCRGLADVDIRSSGFPTRRPTWSTWLRDWRIPNWTFFLAFSLPRRFHPAGCLPEPRRAMRRIRRRSRSGFTRPGAEIAWGLVDR